MLQCLGTVPSKMSGYHIARLRVFVDQLFHGSFPSIDVGIASISEIIVFGTFYKASAIQYFFLFEPNNNIVLSMACTWIKSLKFLISDSKDGVFFKMVGCLGITLLNGQLMCQLGCIGRVPCFL